MVFMQGSESSSSVLSSSSIVSSNPIADDYSSLPPVRAPMSKAEEFAKLARKQEILLDILSSSCSRLASSSSLKFLMNDVYEDALSTGELEMKNFYHKMMIDMKK